MILFSLQKALALLVMPAGLVWLFLMGAGLFCFHRRQRGLAISLLLVSVFYGAAGNIHLGAALLTRLEATVPALDLAALEPFDAVCVLGGGISRDPLGRPQLDQAGDRVYLAARLWHQGKAKVLVASGMIRVGPNETRDCGEETRALWRAVGVPDDAILVVKEPCWITRDEIFAYRRLQLRLGWKRTALLSTAAHLPRALAQARKADLAVTPIGAEWRGRRPALQLQSLVPQAEGFSDVQRACWECLGRWLGR